ncbi:MAG: hypothetical protein LBS27_00390 [Bifidobacteriaceae bacterium]|jgi:hypothetical protein|nr:hypothetical protein [Bifidobacteriaceae bacterium]
MLDSVVTGYAISGVLGVVLAALVVLPVASPRLRRCDTRAWTGFMAASVLQVIGLGVLNTTPTVDVGGGPARCVAEAVFDLGPSAPSVSMGSAQCHQASVRFVLCGLVLIAAAYGIWALSARRAIRGRAGKAKGGHGRSLMWVAQFAVPIAAAAVTVAFVWE